MSSGKLKSEKKEIAGVEEKKKATTPNSKPVKNENSAHIENVKQKIDDKKEKAPKTGKITSTEKPSRKEKNPEEKKTKTLKKAKDETISVNTEGAEQVLNFVPPKKRNFVKIFTIAFMSLDIAFMVFFFITLTLLLTHTILWNKVYTIITFAVIIANFPFLIYMLVSMLKTTNYNNRKYK